MDTTRIYRTYHWVGRHAGAISAFALVLVIGLALVGAAVADDAEPDFDPGGGVFEIAERADHTLRSESTVTAASFLVESTERNVLAPAALREWHAAAERVRASAANAAHLVDRINADTGVTTPGVFSIVDIVDANLPNGIHGATDDELTGAVATALADGSPFADIRFTLSELAEPRAIDDGTMAWTSPAFIAEVHYDHATFADGTSEELWLREVQRELRKGAVHTDSIGIAIDGDLAFEEAAQGSAPFIFLAVASIVGLIAVVHRSYWSAVVAAAGLGATSLAYYGTAALLGLKMGSLLLAFIVPIAMIGFGVDFFIHGVGRVREMQVEGLPHHRAYPAGMRAVIPALTLAATTSVAAFLVNAVSGTEAIIEFGIGAAVSLAWAYLILGQLSPRAVLGLERFVGPNPVKHLSKIGYSVAVAAAAVVAGLTVALAAVMPATGGVALTGFLALTVVLPALATRRRNRRAAARGRPVHTEIRGVGHGLKSAGSISWFVARWRHVTVPVVAAIGAGALVTSLGVRSGFEVNDFLASDTDFVRSIERTTRHFPSSGEGSSFIFVEGDLTDPTTLAALDDTVAALDASGVGFGRNSSGDLIVEPHAGDYVRMTMASSDAVTAVEHGGATLADADGNGIPDDAAGVRAIFDYIAVHGVPTSNGTVAVTSADVPGTLADDGDTSQATAITIHVGSFTDGDIIVPVWDALDEQAVALERSVPGLQASVSGDVLTQFAGMGSYTESMVKSLPLAVVLTLLIAGVVLRSLRLAIVAVIPIGFVVAGVYAFMAVAGFTVNVVTATIAAIAVGVGIDFSTHFTARFREELAIAGDALEAVRRAGSGTGGALILSAVTSVLGFLVMAMAPTPMFSTFGLLTAVMIGLALVAALLVLPSLLVIAAPAPPRQTGAAIDQLELVSA